jgi:hypothetical protein
MIILCLNEYIRVKTFILLIEFELSVFVEFR